VIEREGGERDDELRREDEKLERRLLTLVKLASKIVHFLQPKTLQLIETPKLNYSGTLQQGDKGKETLSCMQIRSSEVTPSLRAFRVAVPRRNRDTVSHGVTLHSDLSSLLIVTELKPNKQEQKTVAMY
jgi:hypothetical protein